MNVVAPGISLIDLLFLGRPRTIATGVVSGADGVALVDPGPSTGLGALEAGLRAQGIGWTDVRALVLTHIHLDHAGATGTLVKRWPHLRVFVHERGARHLIDPAKLLDSATRLYGADMERLWGEFLAVPAANVAALAGGETIAFGGRRWEVAYTPGHASHHVSYFDASSGVAFVGDTGGIRILGTYVLPPTPPPDIDPDLWQGSVDRILAWRPQTLFLTHFGAWDRPETHLAALVEHLAETSGLVRKSLTLEGTDDRRAEAFATELRLALRRRMPEEEVQTYEAAAPFNQLWLGLGRYWRKKGI